MPRSNKAKQRSFNKKSSPTSQSQQSSANSTVAGPSSSINPVKKIVTFLVRSKSSTTAEPAADFTNNPPSSGYYMAPSGRGMRPVPSVNTLHRLERQNIVLWRRPIQTLNYFFRETALKSLEFLQKLWLCKKLLAFVVAVSFVLYMVYTTPGPHSKAVAYTEKKLIWCAYWIFLGILSSVGLGTGLHTFLLYLGPHIASVTLAAYECHSLHFPEPPYPDQIICPMDSSAAFPNASRPAIDNAADADSTMDMMVETLTSFAASSVVSLWAIMSKVRMEAFMWGAGTALGELPPYFMARAARLSGQEPDDEEYREFVQFLRNQNREQQAPWWNNAKLAIERLVEGIGFVGILLCASIPNPLFDLAGITCGHFLVPFWTFFGATLIGKAVVKMHIQKLFVILAFSEHHMDKCISLLKKIPKIGPPLQAPFKDYLKQQKLKLHRSPGNSIEVKKSSLQTFFDLLVFVMVGFFIVSLINSLAQSYHRRLCQRTKCENEEKHR